MMVDLKSAQEHLQSVKARLAEIDKERDALIKLVEGYEGLIGILGAGSAAQMPLPHINGKNRPTGNVPKGKVSFRSAIVAVLKDARGAELRSEEILKRAVAMGAVTTAKNPVGVVDLSLIEQMKRDPRIRKTAPRTFKWTES